MLHAYLTDSTGQPIEKVYGDYFGNPKHFIPFIEALYEVVGQPREINVLGIGSNTGDLEEAVSASLSQQAFNVSLTISDVLEVGLNKNLNQATQKVVCDNKALLFGDYEFDFVLARSVTHYEPTRADEIAVLSEVKRVLVDGGWFVDQPPALYTEDEAQLLADIHKLVNKPMNVQIYNQTKIMLGEVFSEVLDATVRPPSMAADRAGFIARYKVTDSGVLDQVVQLIQSVPQELRPNVWADCTSQDFGWSVPYFIFLCRK